VPAVPAPAPVDGPVERLLDDYQEYLARERGSYTRMLWMGLRTKAAYLPGC
jgi:hypothetical protein